MPVIKTSEVAEVYISRTSKMLKTHDLIMTIIGIETMNLFQLRTEFLTRTFTVFLKYSIWMQMVSECRVESSTMIKPWLNKQRTVKPEHELVEFSVLMTQEGTNRLKHKGNRLDWSTWHERRQVLSPRRERNTLLDLFRGKISTKARKEKSEQMCKCWESTGVKEKG